MLVCRRLAGCAMLVGGDSPVDENLPRHCRKPNDGSAKMDAMVIATWAVFAAWALLSAWGWGGGKSKIKNPRHRPKPGNPGLLHKERKGVPPQGGRMRNAIRQFYEPNKVLYQP